MTKQSRIAQVDKKLSDHENGAGDIKYLHHAWKFREQGTNKWYKASVPGCNFTDLHKNGAIEAPFYRDNEQHLQWIENKDWEYETTFKISVDELKNPQIDLIFEGLDTYADIYLNDQKIGHADNMFVEWAMEVRAHLRTGENTLRVYFHSPLSYVRQRAARSGITYPAGNDHSEDKLSVFSRKAPYHFGWDWGPRFVTSGIWRPVYLRFIRNVNVQDLYIRPEITSQQNAVIYISITLTALLEGNLKLTVDCLNEPLKAVNHIAFLKAGENEIKLKFSLKDFKSWWPHGMGEPFLYHFRVSINDHTGTLCSISKKVGIRTVEVINKPDDHGKSFYFKVNGVPLFAKGANYIPPDSFLPRVSDERYRELFENMAAANMNMVRVWGGGTYECNLFYDLADQYGMLVWQDFMFACTLYPGDKQFLLNVKKEAVYNIKRLRGHASIALWCGNNEIEVGWGHWGWQEQYDYSDETQKSLTHDYKQLFERLLPDMVSKYDPYTFYLPSSPVSNYEKQEDFTIGDVHYWGVWHGGDPFSDYKKSIPRFMSEFGFQSFPLLESVKKYTLPADWDISSPVMRLHQKHPRGNQLIKDYLLDSYKEPKNFESFLYLSQVQQAEGLKIAIEAHRRNKPYCMGSLYWQLNDCWPVASWSGIDYFGKWKAMHYYAAHAFEDILVTVDINDHNLNVYAVSDRLNDENGELLLEIMTLTGEIVKDFHQKVKIGANQSNFCVSLDLNELVSNFQDRDNLLIYTKIQNNGMTMCDNVYYLTPIKDLSLQQPNIEYSASKENSNLRFRLQSNVLVKNLYLRFDDSPGNFSDNFFDLVPGKEKEVTFPLQPKSNEGIPKLKMMSIIDTF